jgi:hypothetical protein
VVGGVEKRLMDVSVFNAEREVNDKLSKMALLFVAKVSSSLVGLE